MLVSRIGALGELWAADLYAGSGALGIEALSRGAAKAVFVENDRSALGAIQENLETLGLAHLADVRALSAASLPPPNPRPFDVIFADPPYEPGSGSAVVAEVARAGWLAPGGWLAIETDAKEQTDPGPFKLEVERKVGRARLTLLSRPA